MSHGHNHGHHHHDLTQAHTHSEKSLHEYRNYFWLFAVSLISVGEFLIALLYANSVSAQADAIHSITHIALYGLTFWVSRQIYIRKMDVMGAHHYRERFTIGYVGLVFLGLTWILYTSIVNLFSSEHVLGSYMLISVTVGLIGNTLALIILNTISKMHGGAANSHKMHRWLNLDTWGDFAFSVIVLVSSVAAMAYPSLPINTIDPVVSIAGVAWIGWSGIQIVRKKTI